MDFSFSEREELLRKTVCEFAEKEIAPMVQKMEESGEFPVELISKMGKMGLTGVITPLEYGGAELGFQARTIMLEEVSRISAATAMTLEVHHVGTYAIQEFGNDDQKKRYLPSLTKGETLGAFAATEPTGGSDFMGMQTKATKVGNDYYLSGRKCFITNTHNSNAQIILAKTGEGSKGLSAFIVEKDTAGFKVGKKENMFGLRGTTSGELALVECKVPKENLLGSEGDGVKIGLQTISEVGRSGTAAVAIGIIRACLEAAVKFSRERTLYGNPISKLQAVQFMISDTYADLESARLLCYKASWLKDNKQRCDVAATLAKYYACEAAIRSAKMSMEIHGSYGIVQESPVQRYLRDALVSIPSNGTSQIARIIVSREALSTFK
jgi:alkylation response protein AidB-like acyl-CoA dehydrogenase